MLSRRAIGVAHAGQADGGRDSEAPVGARWTTTLRNDPTTTPRAAEQARSTAVNEARRSARARRWRSSRVLAAGYRSPVGVVPDGASGVGRRRRRMQLLSRTIPPAPIRPSPASPVWTASVPVVASPAFGTVVEEVEEVVVEVLVPAEVVVVVEVPAVDLDVVEVDDGLVVVVEALPNGSMTLVVVVVASAPFAATVAIAAAPGQACSAEARIAADSWVTTAALGVASPAAGVIEDGPAEAVAGVVVAGVVADGVVVDGVVVDGAVVGSVVVGSVVVGSVVVGSVVVGSVVVGGAVVGSVVVAGVATLAVVRLAVAVTRSSVLGWARGLASRR
jgi:hypothetical protein